MQITANTTGMEAEVCVSMDKDGRDSCVTVVKGTFRVIADGSMQLAEEQVPLTFADEHFGDPASSATRYESDFAPFKPCCDVLLNGSAYAKGGRPATEVDVSLTVGPVAKSFRVVGDRIWDQFLFLVKPTHPEPFFQLPITYDRGYGGEDVSSRNSEKRRAYPRNPVGVGYHPLSRGKALIGKPLPNTEPLAHRSGKARQQPLSFGSLGRNFGDRIRYAGSYDESWLANRFPLLPHDFDEHYFLSSPIDQQIPYPRGGEAVTCLNLTPHGRWVFTLPSLKVPILYRFRDRDVHVEPNLDTVLIEPDEGRVQLVWRARVAISSKLNWLAEILVGPRSSGGRPARPIPPPIPTTAFEGIS